jgi:hypothetical protein
MDESIKVKHVFDDFLMERVGLEEFNIAAFYEAYAL